MFGKGVYFIGGPLPMLNDMTRLYYYEFEVIH